MIHNIINENNFLGVFSLKKLFAYILIISGILSILFFYAFLVHLRPRILTISQSFVENEVSMIIDEEVKNLMLEEFLSYDKITLITRDSEGKVTSVSINSVLVNNFANELDIKIGDKIENADTIKNEVYITGLIGADFLSGIGPKIPIRFQPVSVTNADITHSFEEAGINQTIHTIILSVSVDIEILLPLAHSQMTVSSQMPIAQTLIIGNVPKTYLNKK